MEPSVIQAGLAELKTFFQAEVNKMGELVKTRDAEIKQFGQATAETAKKADAVDQRIVQIAEDLTGLQKKLEDLQAQESRPDYGAFGQSKSVG
jgi:uncharacterized coiled-coil DUF342 family protein